MAREKDLWWGTTPGRSPQQRADRRSAVRYPVPASRQDAKLKIASSSWPVRVVDVSTGGFTVLASVFVEPMRPGLVGELCTADGKFAVRVVNVSEMGSREAAAPPARKLLRLGLYHLGELTPSGRDQLAAVRPWKSRAPRRWRFSQRTATVLLTAVVLAIVLLPLLLVPDAQAPDRTVLRALLSWGRGAIGLGGKSHPQQPAPDAAGVVPSPADESPESRAVRQLARTLPGAEPFAAPEVVHALGLGSQQQAQLGELREATTLALRELDDRRQNEGRQTHATRCAAVLDAARQEALKLLTPSQRAAWAKLTQ